MEAVLRTLVTGGAGFIGSHLCRRLLDLGHEVYAIDNLATGDMGSISSLESHPRFHFRLHDVTVSFDVGPVDRIYHLAGTAPGVRDPHHGVDIVVDSVLGTRNALGLAKRYEARFLLASSRAVYGATTTIPQREDDIGAFDPRDPRSAHAEGKRAAESLLVQFAQAFNADARIARIFDAYGPGAGSDGTNAIATLVDQGLRGGPLVLPYVEADEQRSFCHVDDLVDGLVALMEGPPGTDPVNLGHPDPVTSSELAAAVADATGVRDTTLVQGSRDRFSITASPLASCPDLQRARDRIGFEPRVSLGMGIRRLVAAAEGAHGPPLARSA